MEGSTLMAIVKFGSFGIGSCLRASRRLAFAGVTCTFAVGGVIVGTISGALKGQTTETGLLSGAGIGAVAGALVSVDLLESLLLGEPLSKTAMFESLLDGKIFREWVSPATLKAYQWQVDTLESSEREEHSDIFDTSSNQGASPEVVRKLPRFEVSTFSTEPGIETSCAICLKDYEDGENVQRLPTCRHSYHMACIERWLARHSSCPICRQDVS
ncbi:hypothetical protein Taro_031546 [Colocasia esculenta]|uniref:RING-type domain-containing protein n=1 Tax=Colocasia esculenta TaxID=4460 RepID=A0A843VP57_COLES|nr:hypothetical protein [Colocasia esculenta]